MSDVDFNGPGITSLVAAPLERDGHFCGAIGVDNPPLEQLVNIGPFCARWVISLCCPTAGMRMKRN